MNSELKDIKINVTPLNTVGGHKWRVSVTVRGESSPLLERYHQRNIFQVDIKSEEKPVIPEWLPRLIERTYKYGHSWGEYDKGIAFCALLAVEEP